MLSQVAKQVYVFPNGMAVYCAKVRRLISVSAMCGRDNRNLGAGSSTLISGSTLRMTGDDSIEIGKFNAFSVKRGGDGAGGGNRKRALQGRYALDGHLITMTMTEGEILVGFISWSSDCGGDSIDHVFINGEHFWNRDD
jgi:hypothetical protein